MNTIAQDIGLWVANIPNTGRDLSAQSFASRRSSFNSSAATGSPALSSDSQLTSATSVSTFSYSALDPSLDSDSKPQSFILQQDLNEPWQRDGDANAELHELPYDYQHAACGEQVQEAFHHRNPNDSKSALGWSYHPNVVSSFQAKAERQPQNSARWNHRLALKEPDLCNAANALSRLATEAARLPRVTSCLQPWSQPCKRDVIHPQAQIAGRHAQVSANIHPRRSSTTSTWMKPSLVRQEGRRDNFVMHLVECAAQLVNYIWPSPSPSSSQTECHGQVITLSFFIQETLRRSRSTYSTLQVTLYYLYLLKIKGRFSICETKPVDGSSSRAMSCGRRMFLSALILASKYLQDRNYSTKAWSKITSLPVPEINSNEKMFLAAIDYSLFFPVEKYNYWSAKVTECVEATKADRQCPWGKIFADMRIGNVSTTFKSAATLLPTRSSSSDITAGDSGVDLSNTKLLDRSLTPPSSRTSTTNMPPSPTLSGTLTTPSISPWTITSGTPAASISEIQDTNMSVPQTARRCHNMRTSIRGGCPTTSGYYEAPKLAHQATSATTRCAKDITASYGEEISYMDSPMSYDDAEVTPPRTCLRGGARPTAVPCYVPSPLRFATTQLPTPSLSARSVTSVTTASLDSPSSSIDSQSGFGIHEAVTKLLYSEAQSHGLQSTVQCCGDSGSPASFNPESQRLDEDSSMQGNLPELVHVLRTGFKEHLLRFRQRSASPSPLPVASAAGVKRGRQADCGDAERMAKVQRCVTWN